MKPKHAYVYINMRRDGQQKSYNNNSTNTK